MEPFIKEVDVFYKRIEEQVEEDKSKGVLFRGQKQPMDVLAFLRKYDIQNAQEFESYWDNKLKWEDYTAIHHELWNYCDMFNVETLDEGMTYICELWRKTKEWEKEHPGHCMASIKQAEAEFGVFQSIPLRSHMDVPKPSDLVD